MFIFFYYIFCIFTTEDREHTNFEGTLINILKKRARFEMEWTQFNKAVNQDSIKIVNILT